MFNNKKKRLINLTQKGFTYVEGILAISLTLAASTAIAFGIQKSISTYKSQGLKDKALEALIQYTEDYRMMAAYGENFAPGKQPRGDAGHLVVLYNAEDERADNFSFGTAARKIEGNLFHDIQLIERSAECDEDLGERQEYYNIKTWIEWEDPFDGLKDDVVRNRKNLSFEVNQIIVKKRGRTTGKE